MEEDFIADEVAAKDTEELTEEEADFLEDAEESENDEATENTNEINVSKGDALILNEVINLTSKSKHKIILFAGSHFSGKTSLISNIYINFQKGLFKHIKFAGSQTIVGFEKKCWTARTPALLSFAQTARTIIGEPNYLHLKVRLEKDKTFKDLLFCDISGEKYDRASSSEEACRELEDIDWLDHFVLLIDAEKLRLLNQRNSAYEQARQLILRLLDSQKLKSYIPVQVLFSKAEFLTVSDPVKLRTSTIKKEDLIASKEETSVFKNKIIKELKSDLMMRNVNVSFFEISAHNIYGSSSSDPFDLDLLINHWLKESAKTPVNIEEVDNYPECREINKFYLRELEKYGNC
jgi:Double-GTPase 2